MNENLNNQENLNNSQNLNSVSNHSEPTNVQPMTQPSEPTNVQPMTQPSEPTSVQPMTQPSEPTSVQPMTQPSEPTNVQPMTQPSEPTNVQPMTQPSEPTSVQPMTQPSEPNSDPDSLQNLKSNKWIIFAIIAIILLIGVGVFGFLFLMNKNPKTVFKNTLAETKEAFNKYVDSFNTQFDIYSNKVSTNTKITFETNLEELKDFEKLQLNMITESDYQNKYLNFEGNIKEENKQIVSLATFLTQNQVFLTTDLLNKQIKIADFDFNELIKTENAKQNIEDFKYIVNQFIDYVSNSLVESQFEKASEKLNINGKDVSVTANTYTIDNKTINTMGLSIIDSMLKDDKLLELLAKYSDITKEELVKNLEDTKAEITASQTTEDNEVIAKLTVYTTTKFIGFKLVEIDYDKNENELINYTDYKDVQNLLINIDEKTKLIGKKENNIITFALNDEESNIDFNYNCDNKDATVTIKDGETVVTIKLNFVITEISENEKNIKTNIIINTSDAIDNIEIKIYLDSTQYLNKDITIKQVQNYITLDELTDKDSQTMLENFYSNIEGTIFEELINGLMSSNNYYEDDFYEYDY